MNELSLVCCFYFIVHLLQVYSASREDFLRFAGSGGGGGASDNVSIIRMQGLPYRASEEDIVRMNSCVAYRICLVPVITVMVFSLLGKYALSFPALPANTHTRTPRLTSLALKLL